MRNESKYPLSRWETLMGLGVFVTFGLGLFGVYLSMPASDYSFLKLPRTLEDLQILRDHLESYTSDYTAQVLVGYCTVYIFMQTFMIPGTIFMSLLAGALFGVLHGVALVVFAATAGASSCYFLSKLIGRPLVFSLWPDKLTFFQAQVEFQLGYLGPICISYVLSKLLTIIIRTFSYFTGVCYEARYHEGFDWVNQTATLSIFDKLLVKKTTNKLGVCLNTKGSIIIFQVLLISGRSVVEEGKKMVLVMTNYDSFVRLRDSRAVQNLLPYFFR